MPKELLTPEAIYCYRGRGCWPRPLEHIPDRPRYLQYPQFTYINELVPPFIINPDAEMHLARKKRLTPLSKDEAKFAEQELHGRIDRLHNKMKLNPRADYVRSYRTYEMLIKANGFLDHNTQLLAAFGRHYDSLRLRVQSPEFIRGDHTVIDGLTEILAAEEASLQGWPEEEVKEKEEHDREIRELIMDQDDANFMLMFARGVDVLEARESFWTAELATVIQHQALADLDLTIDEYHDRALEV
jgi:hypothetical protein